MSYRILVRRADTDLANIFLGVMEDYPFVLLTPSAESLDWSDEKAVGGYFDEKSPSLVVHFTESFRLATESDVAAASSLSKACTAKGVPLLQLSSFEVGGEAYRPEGFCESDTVAPDTSQGDVFVAIEKAALGCSLSLILRLPWVVDMVDGSLFDHVVPKLLDGKLEAVSDHHRLSLVSSGFVVRSLIALIHQIICGAENWGIYHLRSSDQCSEAEFVDATVRMLNSEGGLDVVMPSVKIGRDEARMLCGSANFNGRKCTDDFGIQLPSWRHGFKSLLRRWLHDHKMVPDLRKVER